MVGGHALSQGFASVVLAVHQGLASNVVLAFDLGWVEFQVVAAATGLMNTTAFDSFGEHFFVDFELKHSVDLSVVLGEHAVELLGLDLGSWETVEENTTFTLWLLQVVLDESNDKVIWDEIATLHDSVGCFSKLSSRLDGSAEHVAGGEMADAEIVSDFWALGTLARSWGSNHDDVHGWFLSAFVSAFDLTEEVFVANVAEVLHRIKR